jgi:CBS domain-containing protein
MKVSEAMTRNVQLAAPGQSIRDVAKIMAESDTGFVPVGDKDRLVGMITDRDIAVRGVAAGKGPDTPVSDVMTDDVKYCYEDEELDHVAKNMGEIKVHRLPVMNRDKRLVGVLAIGDVAQSDRKAATAALTGSSRPSGPHNQSMA